MTADIHPESLRGMIEAAGGTYLTGGGAALTSFALARFVVAVAEHTNAAAPTARQPLPTWQPIETAPKDGTDVMLSNGKSVSVGSWLHQEPVIRERRDLDGRYIDQDEFDGFEGWVDWGGGMQPAPTHWMPLPPPPGGIGEGEKP